MFKKIGNRIKRHKIFSGVLIILLAAGIWYLRSTQQSAQVSFQRAKVERGKIVSTVTASGQVVVANRMAVTTTAGGLVKEVFVNNGDSVKTGDKILEIEPDAGSSSKQADSWNSYLTAKNAVDSAQATALVLQSDMFTKWQAFLNLATNSTYQNSDQSPNYSNRAASQFHIAEADWLAAQAKFKNQQAVISQTQAGLNSTWLAYQNLSPTVTAPTGGTVSDLILAPGMTIAAATAGTKVAAITNDGQPVASVNVSEVDVPRVAAGQEAILAFDALPDKTFPGRVIGVDNTGIITSGVTNYPATIELEDASENILPNMSATSTITIAAKDNVLLVPRGAVQINNGRAFVRVLENGRPRVVPVKTGLGSETQTEIVSGLSEGEAVITGTSTPGQSSAGASQSPFNTQFRFGAGGVGGNQGGAARGLQPGGGGTRQRTQ